MSGHVTDMFQIFDCIRVVKSTDLARLIEPRCLQLLDVRDGVIEHEAETSGTLLVCPDHANASHLKVGCKIQICRMIFVFVVLHLGYPGGLEVDLDMGSVRTSGYGYEYGV